MIDTVMSVCGDRQYYDMAEYSIPCFLRENAGSKLTVFSDEPERLSHIVGEFKNHLSVLDFNRSLDRLTGKRVLYANAIMENVNEPWEHHGMEHVHKYVALLPVLAEEYTTQPFILKIDVDSWFKGDMLIKVIGRLIEQYSLTDTFSDVYLVNRPDNGIIKTFGNEWPGVGFLLWPRGFKFVEQYSTLFNGNEQETILVKLCHERKVSLKTFGDWHWHTVYPWIKAEETGVPFNESDLPEPYYIHIHASHAREKLEELYRKNYG